VAGEVEEHADAARVITPRRVVLALIALYVLLFVILNTRRVHVSFVLFSVRTHLLTALILVGALGFLAGFFVRGRSSSGRLFGRSHADETPASGSRRCR
jgi:uncharacterized integral membrane protein